MKDKEDKTPLAGTEIVDAEDKTACADCVAFADCAILNFVNKLSLKRDNKKVDNVFKCSIFVEADWVEELICIPGISNMYFCNTDRVYQVWSIK